MSLKSNISQELGVELRKIISHCSMLSRAAMAAPFSESVLLYAESAGTSFLRRAQRRLNEQMCRACLAYIWEQSKHSMNVSCCFYMLLDF